MARSDSQCALRLLQYACRRCQSGDYRLLPSSTSSEYAHVNSVGIPTRQNNICWRGRPPFGEPPCLFPCEGPLTVELEQAAKGVAESQDILIDVFGRIESFFGRLEIYTGVPLTPEMTNKMVEITVEILDILAAATKEMKRSVASKSDLRLRFRDADIVPEKFLKRVIGQTGLEDGMKTLDKLTNEEVAMASAQLLKVAHNVDKNVTEVNEGVGRVDENVLVVKSGVQIVNNIIKAVDDKVQTMADGEQHPFGR